MTMSSLIAAKLKAYDSTYSIGGNEVEFPYERTYEVCNEHTVCMFSGNVIKINTYALKEPFTVYNHDREFCKRLEQMRLEQTVVYTQEPDDI